MERLYRVDATISFVSDDFLTIRSPDFESLPVLTSLPAVTVDAPDGGSFLVAAAAASFPLSFLTGGWIFWGSDPVESWTGSVIGMNSGPSAKRYVRSHVGDTVVLLTPLPGLSAGQVVKGYRGCTRTIDMCSGVFNNVNNFGGWPQMPGTNPFVDGLLAT